MSNRIKFQDYKSKKIKCQFEERWGQKLTDCTGYYTGNVATNRIHLCPACRTENILRTNRRRRGDLKDYILTYDEKGIEHLSKKCHFCDHEFIVKASSSRFCPDCRKILGKSSQLSRAIGYCECGTIFPAIGLRKFCPECAKKTPYVKYRKPQLKHRKDEKLRNEKALELLTKSKPIDVIVPPDQLQRCTPRKFEQLANRILSGAGYKIGAVR